MVCSRLLATTLLGLAAVGRAIHFGPSIGSAEDPEPFDPASDGILIFSQPKTGTESLARFAGSYMKPPCAVFTGGYSEEPEGSPSTHRAIKCHEEECALDFIKSRPVGSRTWVISSNRNPYARAPSVMFEMVARQTDEQIRNWSMSDLFTFFHDGTGVEKYQLYGVPQQVPRWYTQQYKGPLGLDVFAHQFDFHKKHMRVQHVFDNRTLEVLVLRLEDSAQWETILEPFFPGVTLPVANSASEKSGVLYSKYTEFVSALQYTEKEIDTLSQSEELNFFYTREEKESFILKVRESSSGRLSDIHANDLEPIAGLPKAGFPWC